MEYCLVRFSGPIEKTASKVENRVRQLLAKDWRVQGGANITYTRAGSDGLPWVAIVQTMVRGGDIEFPGD